MKNEDEVPVFRGGVEAYDSAESMIDSLKRNVDAADKLIRPEQDALQVGDVYKMKTEYGFTIYGEIKEMTDMKGYRLVEAFSEACPDGELGDAHVCTMIPISKEEFYEAKKAIKSGEDPERR